MKAGFFFLILLHVLILIGIIAYHEYWPERGDKILLRAVSMDPTGLLRADYGETSSPALAESRSGSGLSLIQKNLLSKGPCLHCSLPVYAVEPSRAFRKI